MPSGGNARDAVSVPAILMMVAAGLAIAFGLFSIVTTVATAGSPEWMLKFINDPALRDQMREAMAQNKAASSGPLSYGWPIIMILANGFAIFGALQMKALKSYPLALGAAIVSAIPCLFTSCCCIFSMPAGIWAIVVLMRADVKQQFS